MTAEVVEAESINNRSKVQSLMPVLKALLDAHIEYIMAPDGRAEKLAKEKRNAIASTLTADEVNVARMFVASMGALITRWA